MLALATFFPTADSVGEEGFDLFGVRIKIIKLLSIKLQSIILCIVISLPKNLHIIYYTYRIFYLQEFLKSSIDLADLVGILLVLNSIPGKGHAKVLTAGIGWAGAEVLLTRFLLLWVGARGAEFDWKYIQKSLESNINLVRD